LSDVAELPEQIDVERAQAAKARAEEALRRDEHDAEAKAALARADVRLDVAGSTA
jgi:F-type H+-transporting ATPase subunit epsilon